MKRKLYLVAILVGISASLVVIPFRLIINSIYSIKAEIFNSTGKILLSLLFIYAVLLAVAYLLKKFPKINGSGLPQTQALLFGKVVYTAPYKYLVIKFIGGILAILSGLSLGREGSSVQMGSLTGLILGKVFKINKGDIKHLIAAGAGAGVSAAFTAPLSSSILILESLQRFNLPKTTICTLLAGATAGTIAKLVIPYNIYSSIKINSPATTEWRVLITLLFMALFFSLIGKLFSIILWRGKLWYNNLDSWRFYKYTSNIYFKSALLAITTVAVTASFPITLAGDQNFIVASTQSGDYSIIKLSLLITTISLFTVLSNASSYPGGIFLPTMCIGGLCGKLFYEIIISFPIISSFAGANQSIDLQGYYILIGMAAFFIAVVRTPLTSFILIGEMTGHYEVFFPTLIVGIIVFYVTELLKVEPLNDLLYKFMLKESKKELPYTTIYLDVEHGSYFFGKEPILIALPKECEVIEVYRAKELIPLDSTCKLATYDQIGIRVRTEDVEQLFPILMGMAQNNIYST